MAETRGTTGTSKKEAKKGTKAPKQDEKARSGAKNGGDGQVTDTVEQIQHQAGHVVDAAREEAKGQISAEVSHQKERAANSLGILAGSLHDASRQVREQDGGAMAQYLDTAATQVDQFADALQKQDVLQIIDSANEFGRRQPALFMAGAFALGFAGARLLKSGAPSGNGSDTSQWRERANTWNQPSSADRFGGYGGYPATGGTGFDTGYRTSSTDTALDYGRSPQAGYGASSGTGRSAGTTTSDSTRGSDWSAGRDRDTGPEVR